MRTTKPDKTKLYQAFIAMFVVVEDEIEVITRSFCRTKYGLSVYV